MEDWVITAGAAIWSTITSAIAILYRSQLKDLRGEIQYLRKELDEANDLHIEHHIK